MGYIGMIYFQGIYYHPPQKKSYINGTYSTTRPTKNSRENVHG